MKRRSTTTIPTDVRVTYRQQWKRCNLVSCACGTDKAKRHGPYWYAFWSTKGGDGTRKWHSKYIGKDLPLFEEVGVPAD